MLQPKDTKRPYIIIFTEPYIKFIQIFSKKGKYSKNMKRKLIVLIHSPVEKRAKRMPDPTVETTMIN